MSIKDFSEKIKLHISSMKDDLYSEESGFKIHNDLYIVLMIILVGTASYGLGIISSHEKNRVPISVLKVKDSMYASVLESLPKNTDTNAAQEVNSGEVVASKSGTKYYYPWCSGVSRIKEENKVWYKSIEEAKTAGLTPASKCSGLK